MPRKAALPMEKKRMIRFSRAGRKAKLGEIHQGKQVAKVRRKKSWPTLRS